MTFKIDPTKTVVVTGAGISVESGIQPFRGKNGIWEENPMEMATFNKFFNQPIAFLTWYYHRFVSSRHALPNRAHDILADKGVRLITQNIDGLHTKARHPTDKLIEIHGCLHQKRTVDATTREELVEANWEMVDESNIEDSLLNLFKIEKPAIIYGHSFRPHVLLFDEYYTELYETEKAMQWVLEANTIVFIGTSNSVGITEGILKTSLKKNKHVMVVDPNPAASFMIDGVQIIESTAIEFCNKYF